jgi:hypothetical protein
MFPCFSVNYRPSVWLSHSEFISDVLLGNFSRERSNNFYIFRGNFRHIIFLSTTVKNIFRAKRPSQMLWGNASILCISTRMRNLMFGSLWGAVNSFTNGARNYNLFMTGGCVYPHPWKTPRAFSVRPNKAFISSIRHGLFKKFLTCTIRRFLLDNHRVSMGPVSHIMHSAQSTRTGLLATIRNGAHFESKHLTSDPGWSFLDVAGRSTAHQHRPFY